jgi:hypothetical protein
VSNVTLYANTPDNPSRIYQAKPSVIDGVSGFTYLDLPSECMGVSSHLGVKLAWTADRTYRVEGSFDATGNGSMSYIPISSDTGLKASFSPVQTDYGVVFFGGDGIYKTDGYTVTRISSKWRTTYATFVSTSAKCGVIQGTYDIKTKRVWWTINANSSDCDSILVLDLNFALNDNAVFSIFNGASSASLGNTFRPSALVSFSDVMIQGDTKGIVMKYDESYTYDMRVNEGAAYSTWGKMWIPYSYISSEMDFGTIKTRKWIPQMNFKAMNKGTNLSLQFVSVNDDGRVTSDLRPVRYRGSGKTIEEKRKFPAGSLRCGTKRIQFKNAKVVITNSDTLGQATLNTTANTLTLLSGTWPGSGAGDYAEQYISFDNDSYVTEWAIASTSSGVMTISDTGNTLPANGTYKWMIRGYPKDEKLELVSYSLDVALLGPSQQSAKGDSGDNA